MTADPPGPPGKQSLAAAVISIRRAIHSDLPSLNRLVRESRAYDGIYKAILDGYRLTVAQLDRDQVFVAELAAEVVGFYSFLAAAAESELDLLFVSDKAQGMGVGTALVGHLKLLASSLGRDVIRIVSHPPALGFYLRVGARQEGFVPPSGRVTWERPLLRFRLRG